MIHTQKILSVIICSLVVVAVLVYALFFASLSKGGKVSVNIYEGETSAQVMQKIAPQASTLPMMGFRITSALLGYGKNVRSGHYEFTREGALKAVRHLRNRMQTPVKITIPSVRTADRLAAELGDKLMIDSATIAEALQNEAVCRLYGCDTTTILTLFIPNTYEMYWNIPIDKFLKRMQTESKAFWTSDRQELAREAGLSETQVITLASIVDEETANNAEKNNIAGMYINRFKAGMPLQADPTIKYALKQFDLKRIYTNLTFVKSPYNTYRNIGLPPGPIRIPSVAGIDAVLHYAHHDYMYMCAKEDFSGTHNFARTYSEHLQNAAKYSKALNERNIR